MKEVKHFLIFDAEIQFLEERSLRKEGIEGDVSVGNPLTMNLNTISISHFIFDQRFF